MDTFLIKAVQLILAFAILVIIHEFGHFLFARLFGVRVEKFYIFFNPWFSLCKWKPKQLRQKEAEDAERTENEVREITTTPTPDNVQFSTEAKPLKQDKIKERSCFWSETEYGIGWLPLGGYCKISGMIDESMDKEQMKRDPQPWEFRSKPAWQRLLIMVAGVLFNFLLAIIIYAGIVYATGEKYVPFNEAKMGMAYSDAAKSIGFRDGDIPLTADGEILEHPGEARVKMLQAKQVTVLRDNRDTVTIAIPEKFIFELDKEAKDDNSNGINFMTYRIPASIAKVMPGEGADKSGLKEGDEILFIDSVSTPDLFAFLEGLKGKPDKTVTITVKRNSSSGVPDTVKMDVPLSDNSKMGIMLETDPANFFKSKEIHYGLLSSVPRGVELGVDKLTSYASSMKLVFTKEGAQSLGGFGAIGSIFPEKWDWIAFWNIAAFLSVALAFMNILPIPALDGGHVLFLLYEVITRRKPSEKFMEWAQIIGMGVLILLLLYANGMDIVRLFK